MPSSKETRVGPATHISFAPVPLGLTNCPLSIKQFSAEPPDSEGELRVLFKCDFTNETEDECKYVEYRAHILNSLGQIIEESHDWSEQTIKPGETSELSGSFSFFKKALLGANPEQAQIFISVTAYKEFHKTWDPVNIPATPFQVISFDSTTLDEVVKVASLSFWRADLDDQKYVDVTFRALVQNLTSHNLPLQISIDVRDKLGEATDYDSSSGLGSNKVEPGSSPLITCGTYIKGKELKGMTVGITLHAYHPLAAGYVQQSGIQLSTGD